MSADLAKAASTIKTPLSFLALVILVTEGLFLYLIDKSSGPNLAVLVIATSSLPFACLGVFYLLYRGRQNLLSYSSQPIREGVTEAPTGKKYDLFVSAPMAAFPTSDRYESSRAAVFDIVRSIKKLLGFEQVFYAGSEIESFEEFDAADLSVIEDYDAVYNSRYFLMFYPEKLATSALIELGWAMAFKKPIIIFVKEKKEDLPFLMRHLDAAYRNIRIYPYKTSADVHNMFYNNGVALFETLENLTSSHKRSAAR